MTGRRRPRSPGRRRIGERGQSMAEVVAIGERGQSTVEVVAILPVVIAVALALLQALAAGLAAQLADHAAEAGAVAVLQGQDPEDAARKALPGWSRKRTKVDVDGRRIEVRLRPPSISDDLADLLEATAHADAGPRVR